MMFPFVTKTEKNQQSLKQQCENRVGKFFSSHISETLDHMGKGKNEKILSPLMQFGF